MNCWKLATAGFIAFAAAWGSSADPGRAALTKRLEQSLMAPCCWSETVAKHHSPASTEMKKRIAALVEEGRNEREILEYFKGQYGARILAEPEGLGGRILTIVPLAMLAIGLALTILIVRRWRRRSTAIRSPATGPPIDLPEDW